MPNPLFSLWRALWRTTAPASRTKSRRTADESRTSSNQTQLSIYVRYIYKDNVQKIYQVTEDFCGFVEQKPTDAEIISRSLWENLRNWGFDLTKLRWQGYDGCSTMSGEVSGVKTRITEESTLRSWTVNLVFVNNCQNVPVFRNSMAILGKPSKSNIE